jgi:hypothetical protein
MTGAGTSGDPYIISTRADLESIITLDHEAYYALGADIDLSGSDWVSLGWNSSYDPAGDYEYFDGSFDGRHHRISNMSVHVTGNDIQDIGLFNFIWGDTTGLGIVKDLAICNATIHVTTAVTTIDIGLLAGGCSNATISGVTVSGTIILDGVGTVDCVGGLLGLAQGTSTISDCYVNVTIDKPCYGEDYTHNLIIHGISLALSYVGGICGKTQVSPVTIEDSVVTLILTNTDVTEGDRYRYLFNTTYVGGIIGHALIATDISGCRTTITQAVMSYQCERFGGLVGSADAALSLTDCSSTGYLQSTTVRGLVGLGSNCTLLRCSSSCEVFGTNVGGGIGNGPDANEGLSCTDCYAIGKVRGEYMGGFLGAGHGTFVRCYFAGEMDVSLWYWHGGFNYGPASVTDCYWDTQVSGVDHSTGGTGKTTAEMQDVDTFTGWNFSTVWNIASGVYPFLRTAFISVTNGCASIVRSFPWVGKFQLSHVL